jgi:hypothetical protein
MLLTTEDISHKLVGGFATSIQTVRILIAVEVVVEQHGNEELYLGHISSYVPCSSIIVHTGILLEVHPE